MSRKAAKRHDSMFAGWMCAAALGLAAMPVCMFADIPPAVWGLSTIAALPIGAIIGLAVRWVHEESEAQMAEQRGHPMHRK